MGAHQIHTIANPCHNCHCLDLHHCKNCAEFGPLRGRRAPGLQAEGLHRCTMGVQAEGLHRPIVGVQAEGLHRFIAGVQAGGLHWCIVGVQAGGLHRCTLPWPSPAPVHCRPEACTGAQAAEHGKFCLQHCVGI